MPTLTASTTAVFTSVGLSAQTIYDVFTGLFGTGIDFGLWLIQVSFPFILVLGLIYVMWRIVKRVAGLGR